MKLYSKLLFALFGTGVLFSCGDGKGFFYKPESAFTQTISKRNVNLVRKLGPSFSLIEGRNTVTYKLEFDNETDFNTILTEKGDTVFSGTVNRFKGLYLLNNKLSSGNYLIHALKVTDSTMTGLNSEMDQAYLIDQQIKKGKLSEAILDSAETVLINPDNKTADILFYTILRKIDIYKRADYKPSSKKASNSKTETAKEAETTDISPVTPKEELKYIETIFPLQVRRKITVRLKRDMFPCTYQIISTEGEIMLKGKMERKRKTIDCQSIKSGTYYLTILENEETIVFVKK